MSQPQQQQQQYQTTDVSAQYLQERLLAQEKIAQDIDNVHQMHKDLNYLVHEQGEQVDCLESHIEEADEQVEQGVQQLEAAAEHAVSARKKKIILAAVCGILMLILIGFLISYLTAMVNMGKGLFSIILVVGVVILLAISGYFIKEKVQNGEFGLTASAAATTAATTAGNTIA